MKSLIPFLILCLIATCNAELRKWTAINGKEVEAEFVSNEKGIVKLKLKSGKVFEVPADKLSNEDNDFISSLTGTDEINENDKIFDYDGVKVIVDEFSLNLIDGTEIDFKKEGLNEAFSFRNPNISSECGCGESFSI